MEATEVAEPPHALATRTRIRSMAVPLTLLLGATSSPRIAGPAAQGRKPLSRWAERSHAAVMKQDRLGLTAPTTAASPAIPRCGCDRLRHIG